MNNLETVDLVHGINPNLAAGQRCFRMETATVRGAQGESQYRGITVPHNPQFYNFGIGQFTIYTRFLFLGANYDTGFGSAVSLLDKAPNSTGYRLNLMGLNFNPAIFFLNGGGGAGVTDLGGIPLDGQFHSVCATRATETAAEAADLANVRLYRDGVEVTGANRASSGTVPNFDSANELNIGGLDFKFLRGYVDVCAFYNVGLSLAEIAALDNPNARTDRSAKFILDFNQTAAVPDGTGTYVGIDSTSIGQNAMLYLNAANAAGRSFVRMRGIRTFAAGASLAPALNGPFAPATTEKVVGLRLYDADVTAVEYSLNNVTWNAVGFDAARQSVNFPTLTIGPAGASPALYLRASNANPSFLNALELIY